MNMQISLMPLLLFCSLATRAIVFAGDGRMDRMGPAVDPNAAAEVVGPTGSSVRTIRIAGAQIPVNRDVSANLAAISRAIDFAVAEKADLLLTPEGSLSGYTDNFDPSVVSQALEGIRQKTVAGRVALALGTCFQEPDDQQRYDQIRFYAKDGTYLGFHSKILLCKKISDPTARGEIDYFKTKPLRTFRLQDLTLGALVCNDFWANPEYTPMDDPHLTQQLAKLGARIILLAVNGGPGQGEENELNRQYHEANLRMRARTARVWVIVADNCGNRKELFCSAPCGVISPEGKWVIKTPARGEQFFAYSIEITP
jgi:predicted amidohydrolase